MKNSLIAFALLSVAVSAPASAQSRGGHVYEILEQNGSHEHGTAAFKPRGDKTVIEVHLLNTPPGVSEPSHLHAGTCGKLDPVPRYALKSLKDGIAETTIDVPMNTLVAEHLAINVHESAANLKHYVACGNITQLR